MDLGGAGGGECVLMAWCSIRNWRLRGWWMRDLGCEDAGRYVLGGDGLREAVVGVL